jgi:hypothetical protein
MRKIISKIAGTLLGLSLAVGVGAATSTKKVAETKAAITEYALTIGTSDFNTTSYAANNGEHTKDAVCTSDSTKVYSVTWYSNQVYQNSSLMQWQKSNGYIYNITPLENITSVTVNSTAGSFTTYFGDSEHPTSGTTTGKPYFTVQTGTSAAGKTSSIVITFSITSGSGPSQLSKPNPVFNNATKEVTWNDVANASKYQVSVENNTSYSDAASPYSVSSLSLNSEHTIYVKAIGDGANYLDSEEAHVTFTPTEVPKFVLVNSTASLVAGSSYIITNGMSGSVNAMAVTANSDNRKVTAVNVVSSKISQTDEVLRLTLGGTTGAWTFYTENYGGTAGYLNATNSTEKNYLRVVADLDDYSYFTISFSGDNAVITCTGKSSRNILMCNSSGAPMSCYTSGQSPVYLWKEVSSNPVPLTDIGLKNTEEVTVGSNVNLTPIFTPANADTKTTLVWSTSDESVATVNNGVVTGVSVGETTITVYATDISKSASCVVTVNPLPPVPVTHTIAQCYSVAKGTSVSFNGVYMGSYGTSTYNGLFFADGEYGIMIFGTSSIPQGWEVGHTVVAVSGTTDFYNGLVQIKSASFQATTATVSTPVVYNFTGSENSPVALSRKTSLSGTVTNISGTISKTTDATITIDVGGGKSAIVFIKKNSFTDEQIADYVEKFVNGNYVVVTGFLNYYNKATTAVTDVYDSSKFQVIIPTIISTVVYTADAFATDFKSSTKSACESIESERLSGLQSVWGDVAASYSALSETEKENFVDSSANANIKDALARYCHICGKYNTETVKVLEEFVEGATIIYKAQNVMPHSASSDNNASTIIIVVVALTSITSIGVLLVIKRKRSLVK